jgi:hypothetical protein
MLLTSFLHLQTESSQEYSDPDPRKLLWQCHQIKVGRGPDRAVWNSRKRLRYLKVWKHPIPLPHFSDVFAPSPFGLAADKHLSLPVKALLTLVSMSAR